MKKLIIILAPFLITAAFAEEVKRKTASDDGFSTSKCPKFIIHNQENTQISGKLKGVRLEKIDDYASKKVIDGIVLYFEQVRKESNFPESTGPATCQALPTVYFQSSTEKAMFYSAVVQALAGNLTIRVKTNVSDGSIGGRNYSLLPNTVELM